MKKRIVLILAVALLASFMSGCKKGTQINIQEVVAKIQANGQSLKTFKCVMELTTEYEGSAEKQSFNVWIKDDGRYRMEGSVAGAGNFLTVYDGQMMWIYSSEENSVLKIEMSLEELAQDNNLTMEMFNFMADAENLFTFTYKGTETISGRKTYILDVKPKTEDMGIYEMTWWIDTKTWFPVSYAMKMEGLSFKATYSEMEFNKPIDDSVFTFTPPEGAEIFDMGSMFNDLDPNFNPEELELSEEELEQLLRELEGQQQN